MTDQMFPKFQLLFLIEVRNRSLIPHLDQPIFAVLTIFLIQATHRNVVYEKKFRYSFGAQSVRKPQCSLDPIRTPAIRGPFVKRYQSLIFLV